MAGRRCMGIKNSGACCYPVTVMARLVRMCVKIAMVVAIPSCRAQARHPRLAVLKPRKGVDGGPPPTMTWWECPCRRSRYFNAHAGLSGPSPHAPAATDGPDEPGHDGIAAIVPPALRPPWRVRNGQVQRRLI